MDRRAERGARERIESWYVGYAAKLGVYVLGKTSTTVAPAASCG
jgi:hypothetical protein